jgi:hypothetical protein
MHVYQTIGRQTLDDGFLIAIILKTETPHTDFCVQFKADLHIACRVHAVPLPYRGAKGFRMCLSHFSYTVRPCLIHTCQAAPMPCSDHAVLLKAMAQHCCRETACGLPAAFGFFRLPRGVPRRLLSESYQSSSQRSIPTTVKSGSNTLQKRRSVKLLG